MKKFLLFGLLIFGLVIRFCWLDQVPPGLNHDEMDAVMIARSYAYFGTDTVGQRFPVSLIKNQIETGDDTLLSLMLAPFQKFLPMGVSWARVPMVIISLLSLMAWSVFVYKVTQNKKIATIFLLVFLYSPWAIILSRSLTQAPLALLLIALALNVYWKNNLRGAAEGAIFLGLAFLAYYGTKPFTVLLGIGLPFLFWVLKKRFAVKPAIVFWSVFGVVLLIYMYFALTIPGSTFSRRQSEIKFSLWSQAGMLVDTARRGAVSSPLTGLLLNKPAESARILLQRYWNYWSPDYLLFSGDPSANQRLGVHGVAYLPDLFLAALGLSLGLPGLGLAAFLTTTGTIGTLVNNSLPANMYRGAPFLPGFLLLVSLGIFRLLHNSKIIYPIAVIYFFLGLNFLHFFFYRYPVTTSETSFLGERILANYLIKSSGEVTVVAGQPLQVLQQLMFFFQSISGDQHQLINLAGPYDYGRIHIVATCPTEPIDGTLIVQSGVNCDVPRTNNLVIQDQKDTGTLWKIYNDKMCQGQDLSAWRRFHLRGDYSPEKMTTGQFCDRWINKY